MKQQKELLPQDNILVLLAKKYDTDKFQHGYINIYEKILPPCPERILEVGIDKGASIKMWNDYFPDAFIEAMDNYSYNDMIPKKELQKLGIKVHVGNEHDITFLSKNIKGEFDVIILDGSHFDNQRSISFRHLFANNLKTKGILVIEDMHTSNDKGWHPDQTNENNLLTAFQNFIQAGYFASNLFPDHETDFWGNTIEKAELFCDNKMIVVWKK